MTPEEVEAVLGAPERVRATRHGERDERRDSMAIRYGNDDGRVLEVEFYRGSSVLFEEIDLFAEPKAYELLLNMDGEPLQWVETTILLNIGIAMWNFDSTDEARTVGVFRKGRWDPYLAKFRPLDRTKGTPKTFPHT